MPSWSCDVSHDLAGIRWLVDLSHYCDAANESSGGRDKSHDDAVSGRVRLDSNILKTPVAKSLSIDSLTSPARRGDPFFRGCTALQVGRMKNIGR